MRAVGAARRVGVARAALPALMLLAPVVVVVGLSAARASVASTATSTWTVPTEIPAPGGSGYFNGVSCTDPGNCTAVGYDGNRQPIYATEAGGVWGKDEAIDTTTGADDFGDLTAVSCVDPTNCTAVGSIGDVMASVPVRVSETAGTWGPVSRFTDSLSSSIFRSVSCPDTGDCVAVGVLGVPGGPYSPGMAVESGGVWGPATQLSDVPGGAGSGSDGLYGVSCPDAASCTAVGRDGNGQPFYVSERDGAWGTPTQITGFPSGSGGFTAVSCTSSDECTAVGSDGVYAIETNGSWSADPRFFGAASFSSVSCTDATDCTAVGGDAYGTEVDGAGGTAIDMSDIPGAPASLNGVSCTDATDCTAVGSDGNHEPFYASSHT